MNVLAYGGITTVIGLVIVFFGLTILIVAVSIMAAIFKKIDKRKAEKAEAAARMAQANAPKPEPAPAPVEEVAEEEDDPALIAVIAAAIAAYDDSGKRLVVRKVRRVPAWNARSLSRF